MIKLYHIILSLTIAIIFLHTVIPHNHYDEYNVEHSIAHSHVTNIIDLLGLGFHHSNQKDLNDLNQVNYKVIDFEAVELNKYTPINEGITILELSYESPDSPNFVINHYRHLYSNTFPQRAPPIVII